MIVVKINANDKKYKQDKDSDKTFYFSNLLACWSVYTGMKKLTCL